MTRIPFVLIVAAILGATACGRQPANQPATPPPQTPSPGATPPAPPPPTTPETSPLTITGLTTFRVGQRSTVDLPGSDGAYRLTIDDITREQAMVSVAARDGRAVIAPISMTAGDEMHLTVGGVPYVIVLDRLVNELMGDDHAEFLIVPLSVYSPMVDPSPAIDPAPEANAAEAMTEPELIEAILAHVRGLEGAVFIRNGTDHTPADAADHMALKRRNVGSRVKTAEDFIRYCATESSMSGKPYTIRLADGREVRSGEYLLGVLEELRENRGGGE